jgi:carboxymethylenebutenolidase
MTRKTADDFHPEVMKLFDQYVHGVIPRRGFLTSAGKYAAVAGLTAEGLLAALTPQFAEAQQVQPNDKRIETSYVELASPEGNGKVRAYVAKPAKAKGKLPLVLVVHENRGLNPYIEDVARRLGTSNFMAFAPDGLTSVGGYPGDDEKGAAVFGKVDRQKMAEDFVAAAYWLKERSDCSGKVGAVGFCFGGGVANNLAVRMGADLAAAVPFYGGWPAYEEALKANHVTYTAYIYEGANHGFHNDTTPRYDAAAAKLAWQRSLDFFNKYLRG